MRAAVSPADARGWGALGPLVALGSQRWWWHDAPRPIASTEPGLTALLSLQATMGNLVAQSQVQCGTRTQEGSLVLEGSRFPALPRWTHTWGNTGPSPPWRALRAVSRDGDMVTPSPLTPAGCELSI